MTNKKRYALKPCPFCGSDKVDVIDLSLEPYDHQSRFWVQCKCSASGRNFASKAPAIKAWNQRAEPPKKVKR